MHRISLALTLLSVLAVQAKATVISGPVVNPANGNSYYLLGSASWTDSQAEAESLGGNLVAVNDSDEQTWLVNEFGPISSVLSPNSFWIGLNDAEVEGDFVWASGETVTYTNWHPGEPNGGTNGNYVYIGRYVNGQWNDIEVTGTISGQPQPRAVVEVVVPEPCSTTLLVTSLLGLALRRRR